MKKEEFLKLQFQTIREEIRETKARIFKTLGFGLTVIPAAHFFAQTYKIDTLVLSIPFLIVIVSLIYLSENHSLMRCGRFIRLHIESQVEDVIGWEHWLSTPDEFEKRSVDRYLTYSFFLLFIVYYLGSVFFAVQFSINKYGIIPCAVLIGFYVAIGIWFLIFLITKIRVSTTTKTEG